VASVVRNDRQSSLPQIQQRRSESTGSEQQKEPQDENWATRTQASQTFTQSTVRKRALVEKCQSKAQTASTEPNLALRFRHFICVRVLLHASAPFHAIPLVSVKYLHPLFRFQHSFIRSVKHSIPSELER
jgi:hypothetical protein